MKQNFYEATKKLKESLTGMNMPYELTISATKVRLTATNDRNQISPIALAMMLQFVKDHRLNVYIAVDEINRPYIEAFRIF